jgi:acyl-CoA thioesterase
VSEFPDHLARMWREDRASQWLGMSLVSTGPGYAEVTMTVTEHMVNGHGIGHGGLTFALGDTAFAFACNAAGPVTVAHSAQIRFHAPTRTGDVLTAIARERGVDGRRGVYDIEITAGNRLVATFVGNSTQLRGQEH